MAHVLCDATFHEVANNFNNNIVMLNKTYNITNKSRKIEYTCFANVFFCNRPLFDTHLLHTNMFMLLRYFSRRVNYTAYIPLCMQDSNIAPRWKVWKNWNIREPS